MTGVHANGHFDHGRPYLAPFFRGHVDDFTPVFSEVKLDLSNAMPVVCLKVDDSGLPSLKGGWHHFNIDEPPDRIVAVL